MEYGSVCSGVEAASLAWEHLGWQAKFFAEVEPFPAAVLMHRFGTTRPLRPLDPAEAGGAKDKKLRESWIRQISGLAEGGTIPNLGDFTKIRNNDYDGNIDLLVGGCPCQSYSVAGLRKGISDPRGNLSLEFVRLAYRSNARWLVFENVPGLLSSGDCGSDFAGFLSLLCGWEVAPPKDGWRKCGIVEPAPGCFGVAWRILDAQYTRVSAFPRAVPQRRKRLILVGYLGSWLYPAQVLFDGEMRGGDTPPRRTKGEDAASGTENGADPAKWWNGEDRSDTLTCTSHNQLMPDKARLQCVVDMRQIEVGSDEVSPTLIATDYKGGKAVCFENHGQDSRVKEIEVSPVIAGKSGTGGNNLPLVLNDALGFIKNDAGGIQQCYSDGVFPTMRCQATPAVAIAENIIGRKTENGGNGVGAKEEVSYTLNCTGVHGVAYEEECIPLDFRNATRDPDKQDAVNRQGVGVGKDGDPMTTISASIVPGVGYHATVRKLLPVECERLMGFPDNHTRIPWHGKPAEDCPDAPRYKACGNSMAVNVMMWVGERIQAVEETIGKSN